MFWYDDCPILDAGEPKRRPVLLATSTVELRRPEATAFVCVAITTRRPDSVLDADAVQIPSDADTQDCRTGLPRPCWALPRWFLMLDRAVLKKPVGYVAGDRLQEVIARANVRISNLLRDMG